MSEAEGQSNVAVILLRQAFFVVLQQTKEPEINTDRQIDIAFFAPLKFEGSALG